jgi:hypothetical protein
VMGGECLERVGMTLVAALLSLRRVAGILQGNLC